MPAALVVTVSSRYLVCEVFSEDLFSVVMLMILLLLGTVYADPSGRAVYGVGLQPLAS
jgi:hypothetical protein